MGKLTLEEVIVHAKEVAEKNYRGADFESLDSIDDDIKANCIKCAEEHGQLAEWLEELKSYKDLEERLHKIFGEESTFSLADVIDTLEMKLSEPDKKHPVNARILTYEEADKWQEYKELEEQGLLVRLPCKVGDVLYCIDNGIVETLIVNSFRIYNFNRVEIDFENASGFALCTFAGELDEGYVLSREEAEKKLEELRN